MTQYRLIHQPSGRIAATTVATVEKAEGWIAKGWGVLGRRALPPGEGLWLPGVASVHTLLVRFPLDLLFLDSHLETVRIAPETPPGRWLVRAPRACHTLELGAGTLARLGDAVLAGDAWCLERVNAAGCSER